MTLSNHQNWLFPITRVTKNMTQAPLKSKLVNWEKTLSSKSSMIYEITRKKHTNSNTVQIKPTD